MAKPTLSEISKLFKTDDKPTDFHYYGTVVSADVENRTYEVSINRDENITVEAARLVGAHVGDTVMVTVMANGYATVTGRVGGDTDASDAQRKADSASTIADQAQTKAISALSKAAAAEQLASQAEQNARRSADAAELAEENAGLAADAARQAKQNAADSKTAAETAQQNAADSQTAAEAAQLNASGSQLAAEQARDRAIAAEGYASDAQEQAGIAKKEAAVANSYAVGALNSLSTTQDIMGVLNWVEESIKYVWDYPPTVEDKEYDPSKQYYTVIGKRVIDPIETDYDKYYVLNSESEPASKSGTFATFDSFAEKLPLNKLTATINPKQDLHGYDAPWVGGAGKNKLDFSDITGVGWADSVPFAPIVDFINALPVGDYVLSFEGIVTSIDTTKWTSDTATATVIRGLLVWDGGSAYTSANGYATAVTRPNALNFYARRVLPFSITESNKGKFTRLYMYGVGRDSATEGALNGTLGLATFSKFQLESGSTATSWTPYSNICPISGWDEVKTYVSPTTSAEDGTTYTTNLPETVYGGTLDVVNGVLTVDRAMVDLGTLNWSLSGGFFRTNDLMSTVKKPINNQTMVNAISSAYPIMTWTAISTTDTAIAVDTTGRMIVANPNITNVSDFVTAMNGVQLCYELAEPRTIQLTPTQINTLLGENNVWADSGDVTVEYWDGPVGYVTPTSSFDSTETYYTVKGSPVKIDESKQEDHGKGLYYVHDLTNAKEAMADFIKAHLALSDEGLYVLKGPNDWRVLVANDGVYIIDPQGRRVASYKDSITLGTSEGNSIRITSEAITFNIGDKTFAYVAQDKWFASNAEVSGAMYIGDYSLRQKSNGDFVLGRRR